MQGERIEDILTRDELRGLGKDLGKVAFNELIRQGKDFIIDDHAKKNKDWNDRMNDFTRNLNEHFRQHRTLYAEERNVGNKEAIEDRRGLWNAYSSPTGLYKTGKTLYISGTGGKDGSITRDIMDDLFLLPTRNAHHTEKYKDAMKEINESPEITRLVGHSLASAVVNKINEEQPHRFNTTTYATPTIKKKRHGKQDPRRLDYRNPTDVVSILDGYAITSDLKEPNPLMSHSYINWEGNGRTAINPSTAISNGFNPNHSGSGTGAETDNEGYYFTTGDTSTSWELNNVFIRAEVITLDNTVNNNIVKHLLDGQSLKLVFPMYHTITQSFNAGGGEINMNIVKSSSKLTGAFITLYRAPRTGLFDARYLPDNYVFKRWNYMYNPMINKRINNSGLADTDDLKGEGFQSWSKNLSWQIQLSNSQKYPEFEAQSLAETFYYLRRAIHFMNENQDSLSFSYRQYRENKFIIGMSFEKMADVNFTGYNSKMSGITNFKIKGTDGPLPTDEQISEVFCHLISEAVLEIRESGSVVYD
eukprot:Skav232470  [mRNA]  locus=scaffold2877:130252:132528:- [translate_table: standard]